MNQDSEAYRRARKRVLELKAFYSSLVVYVVVNIGLFAIDMLTGGGTWFYWPLLGWGIGMAIYALATFGPWRSYAGDWEERKLRELMEREERAGR